MYIQPNLFFDGRCDEAIAFYGQALGAEVVALMRFGDGPDDSAESPDGSAPPAGKVMHACLRIGHTQLFVSDGFSKGQPEFKGITLSLSAGDAAEAAHLFDGLAQEGQVVQPLMPTFFSPSFGMVNDRFGVSWMVLVPDQAPS